MSRLKAALILIADGTEEMELYLSTITYDILVRAGIKCTSALVTESETLEKEDLRPAVCSRGVKITPDIVFDEGRSGPGAETISKHPGIQRIINRFMESKNSVFVGMICAGSLAALTSKLPRQELTSHPSVESELSPHFDYSKESVVASGKLVTSRGPGTAFPFAFTLVELLVGKETKWEVRKPMIFPDATPF